MSDKKPDPFEAWWASVWPTGAPIKAVARKAWDLAFDAGLLAGRAELEAQNAALREALEDIDFESDWRDNLDLLDRVSLALNATESTTREFLARIRVEERERTLALPELRGNLHCSDSVRALGDNNE